MSQNNKKAVVLLSGGLDSMVAAAIAREEGYNIVALTVDYNQRHKIELQSAARIAKKLDVSEHIILPLDLSRFGGSALTDDIDVPKSAAQSGQSSRTASDIPVTYVPARNLIFLSLTLGLAEARNARDIYIGVNALDYSGYPDCRPEFIEGFERLADLATKAGDMGSGFTIQTPLQYMTKADIAKEAQRLNIDPALSWTCYDPVDGDLHCGQCESCHLRHKGFVEAGIADPTRYATIS
ncbi:7-cyano-7-deazaguanine synthase QueC [Parasphingorhabdus sp. JC815]|uniref:7-cyano-7-deazaguanine synthase QueC n=1 Tax=Parasphingorhabdus sp. JC815 TaxID=3232140 RepID=UPI00345804CF